MAVSFSEYACDHAFFASKSGEIKSSAISNRMALLLGYDAISSEFTFAC